MALSARKKPIGANLRRKPPFEFSLSFWLPQSSVFCQADFDLAQRPLGPDGGEEGSGEKRDDAPEGSGPLRAMHAGRRTKLAEAEGGVRHAAGKILFNGPVLGFTVIQPIFSQRLTALVSR
jgi:hypothetical protein